MLNNSVDLLKIAVMKGDEDDAHLALDALDVPVAALTINSAPVLNYAISQLFVYPPEKSFLRSQAILRICQRLIDEGAKVNEVYHGRGDQKVFSCIDQVLNPLDSSFGLVHVEAFELLRAGGASILHPHWGSLSAFLKWLARSEHLHSLQYVLQGNHFADADLVQAMLEASDSPFEGPRSPLGYVLEKEGAAIGKIVEVLVKAGLDINQPIDQGFGDSSSIWHLLTKHLDSEALVRLCAESVSVSYRDIQQDTYRHRPGPRM